MGGKRDPYYLQNPAWKVPTTWRTEYCWDRVRLSPAMKEALRKALKTGQLHDVGQGTIRALSKRHLCDGKSRLTKQGRILGLSFCSLPRQCAFLGFPINDLQIDYYGRSELAAMDYLRELELRTCYSEGGIIILVLYSLCFDRLYRLGRKHWGGLKGARSWMYTSFTCYGELLDQHPELHKKMMEDISATDEDTMLRAFDTLKGWQGHPDFWMYRNWVGVDHAMARDTFRTLGKERLKKIARLFFTDPYAFQKGWPDLACIDGERLRLIEVKTSDRLHISQLITIPEMVATAQLDVEVVRLRRLQEKRVP